MKEKTNSKFTRQEFFKAVANVRGLPNWVKKDSSSTEKIVKTLKRNGVPSADVFVAEGRRADYGDFLLPENFFTSELFQNFLGAKKASKNKFRDRVEKKAEELGLPSDSHTARKAAMGMLSQEAAEGIAGYIRNRHEKTDYDGLLGAGVSKEIAREMV